MTAILDLRFVMVCKHLKTVQRQASKKSSKAKRGRVEWKYVIHTLINGSCEQGNSKAAFGTPTTIDVVMSLLYSNL